MTEERSLVVRDQSLDAYAGNLPAKLKICEMIAKSGLAPASFKSPESIFAVMLRGGELGFSPMQSLEVFDFLNGRVCIRAAGLQALAIRHGGRFEVLEESDKACTIRASRASNGWSQEYTFSIDDASKMNLTGKDNWKKMPKFMLYARCVSVLCRRGWPDIIGGLYGAEEMRDSTDDRKVGFDKTYVEAEGKAVEVIASKPLPVSNLKTADDIQNDLPSKEDCFVYDITRAREKIPQAKGKQIIAKILKAKAGFRETDEEGDYLYTVDYLPEWEDFCIAKPASAFDEADILPAEFDDLPGFDQ